MIPQHTSNHYTVSIDSTFEDEIKTESGIKLYRDTTFNPANFAATNGLVTKVPRHNTTHDVQEGDQLYFSYQVVMDWEQRTLNTPIHKNLLFYKGKRHWMVNYDHCYFKVKDDKITMLNGYLLLNVLEEKAPESTLIIPEYLKRKAYSGRAQVIASNSDVAVQNDIVFYDKRFVETYELFDKEFYILKDTRVLAKL